MGVADVPVANLVYLLLALADSNITITYKQCVQSQRISYYHDIITIKAGRGCWIVESRAFQSTSSVEKSFQENFRYLKWSMPTKNVGIYWNF